MWHGPEGHSGNFPEENSMTSKLKMTGQRILNLIIKTMTAVVICFLHTMTNWQSWNIWENSLHILQEVKEREIE